MRVSLPDMAKRKVAILISGSGSNMVALLDAMAQADHPAEPVLVFSNRADAAGLEKAQARGVATAHVDHKPFGKDRAAFEVAMEEHLTASGADLICQAGFMRIFTEGFVRRWEGKMINIHPSLLPKHKGLHTHQRALDAGDTEHGCSVHEVIPELDAGPLLGQAKLPIEPGDTAESLATRVLRLEHQLYPMVLRRFAVGDKSPIFL